MTLDKAIKAIVEKRDVLKNNNDITKAHYWYSGGKIINNIGQAFKIKDFNDTYSRIYGYQNDWAFAYIF